MVIFNSRQNKILVIIGVVLLVPLIAMQFTVEVNWSVFDFAIAAMLLVCFGFLGEWLSRKVRQKQARFALIAVVFISLVLIWAELAVGVFGSPLAGS